MSLSSWHKRVLSDDFLFEIGIGRVDNHFAILKFGESDTIGTTETLIYDAISLGAPANIPYLADATEQTFTVKSTLTSDSYILETGAMVVRVFGLTKTGLWQVEDIKMNGTTNVSTQGKYWRLFRANVVKSAGRIGALGSITFVYNSIIYMAIKKTANVTNNSTNMLTFTIPLGYTAVLIESHNFAPPTKAVTFSQIQRNLGACDQLKRRATSIVGDGMHWDYKLPQRVNELTDIEVKGLAASPPTAGVSGDFAFVLSKNNNDVLPLVGVPTIGEDLS